MVDFTLSEEQEMLRDLAHDFARDELRPHAEHWDEAREFPKEAIATLHELGLMNMHIPEEYGGMGFDTMTEVLVQEELAWGDPGFATAAYANGLTIAPLITGGTQEQKQKYLPRMATGEWVGCFGLTEPDYGSNPGDMITKAAAETVTLQRNLAAEANGSTLDELAAKGLAINELPAEDRARMGETMNGAIEADIRAKVGNEFYDRFMAELQN